MFKCEYTERVYFSPCLMLTYNKISGRCEKNLEKFEVSPDGRHLVFLGDNGYMMLVSSRVSSERERICCLISKKKDIDILFHVNLLCICIQTKQWIGNLKMNGTVGAVTFSANGSHMFSTGSKFLKRRNLNAELHCTCYIILSIK